jgi:hypothetical protein
MYGNLDVSKTPIRLWELPNTLAGDGAVTIIIQCIVTWMIELALVSHDLRSGNVQAIGFVPEPKNRWVRWFMLLDQVDKPEPTTREFVMEWATFLVNNALRGFLVAVVSFPFFWPASVGILTTLGTRTGGDWDYQRTWTPEIFKGILGAALAVVTTPPMAAYWLARYGWLENARLRADAEASGQTNISSDAAVSAPTRASDETALGDAAGQAVTSSEQAATVIKPAEREDEPDPQDGKSLDDLATPINDLEPTPAEARKSIEDAEGILKTPA